MARLTKYETHVLPKLNLIEAWARDGLADEQIATNLNVAYSTFRDYRDKFSALSAVLKKGKEDLDVEVENAFIKKCFGYNVPVKKNIKVKTVEYSDKGYKVREFEEIVEVFDEQHIPADTTNQIFFLKNRRSDKWKDKQEIFADVNSNSNVNITNLKELSTEILEKLANETDE